MNGEPFQDRSALWTSLIDTRKLGMCWLSGKRTIHSASKRIGPIPDWALVSLQSMILREAS